MPELLGAVDTIEEVIVDAKQLTKLDGVDVVKHDDGVVDQPDIFAVFELDVLAVVKFVTASG